MACLVFNVSITSCPLLLLVTEARRIDYLHWLSRASHHLCNICPRNIAESSKVDWFTVRYQRNHGIGEAIPVFQYGFLCWYLAVKSLHYHVQEEILLGNFDKKWRTPLFRGCALEICLAGCADLERQIITTFNQVSCNTYMIFRKLKSHQSNRALI